ncbi:hypothetical protein J3459_018078 [Metarhizium acridum]|nr:hypothetical protein J3459_018078 [Metarhizium acridum]
MVVGISGGIYNHLPSFKMRFTVHVLYVEFWNKASVVPVIFSGFTTSHDGLELYDSRTTWKKPDQGGVISATTTLDEHLRNQWLVTECSSNSSCYSPSHYSLQSPTFSVNSKLCHLGNCPSRE